MALKLLLLVQFQALTPDVLTYEVRGNKGTVPLNLPPFISLLPRSLFHSWSGTRGSYSLSSQYL